MELIGKLIEKRDAVVRTERFTVREFIIEVENPRNPQWNDFILFQLTNNQCSLIDNFNVGDVINVTFDIRGRKWQGPDGRISYFTTLSAWRITPPYSAPQPGMNGGYAQPMQPMGMPQQAQPMQQPMQQPAAMPQNDPLAGGAAASDDLPF